jgi:hypothetical protein
LTTWGHKLQGPSFESLIYKHSFHCERGIEVFGPQKESRNCPKTAEFLVINTSPE